MKTEMLELYKEYLRINKLGWIKSKRQGYTGVGYTFEKLLYKEEDNFPIPDFKNIEIKTMRRNSRGRLHLLNVTPDGDFLFPIKRILDKLGYFKRNESQWKVFKVEVNSCEWKNIGHSKRVKLYVNYKEEKLELIAESNNGDFFNIDVSWSFSLLKERLELKLKYLAIVKVDSKIIDGWEFFKYSDISFYELKDFEVFLYLIEHGIITVTFNIDVFKSGKRIGQTHDHGTNFSIDVSDLYKLYKRLIIKK